MTRGLTIGLIVSVALNVHFIASLLYNPPAPSTNIDKYLAESRKEINHYKSLIVKRDIVIKRNTEVRDSLEREVEKRYSKLKVDNEKVKLIPDSVLNDSVRAILRHL